MADYKAFLREARKFLPNERICTDELRRFAWGTDAGFYCLTPQLVLHSADEAEVSKILTLASRHGLPVTFRAAGTSLSGQAVSDSILVVAGKGWESFHVSPGAETITLQPGIVGTRVNQILARHGRHFGPDPASIGSCMVGGIVMNNASGMSCGTHANSDRTMVSARMVLPDGTVLDTGDEASRSAFRASHPDFLREVEAIRDEIRSDSELSARIEYKYSIKNVTGLNILPFLRFDDPFDIVAHLLVGSEGTLAFLSEVTMKTLPTAPFKASAMIYFPDIRSAAEGVLAIKAVDVNAAELLDRRSLLSMKDSGLLGEELLAALDSDVDLTAVLTEVTGQTHEELLSKTAAVSSALSGHGTFVPFTFTEDAAVYSKYWAIRSGIFPAVGGMRRKGTTCLIEDIAFHIKDLPEATADLSALLDRHGYDDSCIYGHALEGNFHFIINQSFSTAADIARYEAMIRDVVEMVVSKYDGSLKAEHGTGRNMAPFVAYEWGDKAFSLMRRVKRLFDPQDILNPGVIFNDDPNCYVRDIKALPVLSPTMPGAGVEEAYALLNKCMECGFCEVNCLSCGFTLSARQRVAVQREMARLRGLMVCGAAHMPDSGGAAMAGKDGGAVGGCSVGAGTTRKDGGSSTAALAARRLALLERQYRYYGEKTCAGDGLCSTSCPMHINVADLTHELRREQLSSAERAVWGFASNHLHGVKNLIRLALNAARLGQDIIGDKAMAALCRGLHRLGVPLWTPSAPRGYHAPKSLTDGALPQGTAAASQGDFAASDTIAGEVSGSHADSPAASQGSPRDLRDAPLKVVYMPSCLNQGMGLQKGAPVKRPLIEETCDLLRKAGYEVIIPKGADSLCCGTIWESKGMPEMAERKVREMDEALWKASGHGRWPILCDQSPCLHRMRKCISRMELYEPAEFVYKFLRPRLTFTKVDRPVPLHLTCSMRLMHLDRTLVELARLCSDNVIIPEGVGCCGFAGDKGFTNPELNTWALRHLRGEVSEAGCTIGYSNSRTCEIGLQANSGIPYVSIVYLVNECTKPKASIL